MQTASAFQRYRWPDETMFRHGQSSQRSNAPRVRSSRHKFTKKLQTSVESFTLTAILKAISENLSFLLWVCVQNKETGIHLFYGREFGLSRHFVYRFHTNVALVKVCSNFETLKNRKWRWFCVRPLWMGSRLIGKTHLLSECNFLTGVTAIVDGIYGTILARCPSERAP